MEIQRIETPHNTAEQVREYLETAQQIADDLGIDREREAATFGKIIDLVSAKQLTVVQQPPVAMLGVPMPGQVH